MNLIYNTDYTTNVIPQQSTITITDPPYNVNYKYRTYKDNLPENEYIELLRDRIKLPAVVIHYAEQTINILPKVFGVKCEQVVVWSYVTRIGKQTRLISWWGCKPDFTKVKVPYAKATLSDKRNKHKIKEGRSLNDHWHIPYINNKKKEKILFEDNRHCPQIPEEVIKRIILTTVDKDTLIIDPFSGTGTTSKVAKDFGYDSIGFEIDGETHKKSLIRLDN